MLRFRIRTLASSILVVWIACCVCSCASSWESEVLDPLENATAFMSLKDAVAFIVECLDTDDYGSLARACVGRAKRPPLLLSSPGAFEVLKKRHRATSLVELYSGADFPQGDEWFKLGGHDKELGHIHIDFRKDRRGWFLEDIYMCR